MVGSEVIERLLDTSHCKEGRLKILAIANSRKMILGVNPSSWSQDLVGPKAADTDLEKICTHITSEGTAHTIIDCTCSEAIANMYGHWLLKDINVVTSNKKAFSGDPEYFKKLIAYQKSSKAALLFESTVWYYQKNPSNHYSLISVSTNR